MNVLSRFFKCGEWNHEVFATYLAVGILFLYWCLGFIVSTLQKFLGRKKKRAGRITSRGKTIAPCTRTLNNLVTESDLEKLIQELNELGIVSSSNSWSFVLQKSNTDVSYFAKRREPKDGGPTEYLSSTIFQRCAPDLLRDFYMDNEFRMRWDKTVVKHEQLEICLQSGTEVGRTVKKFPFMTAREYVLAWRLWEGPENSFYCVIKACEHPAAPGLKEYKRVQDYLSGWRIQTVPGTNACEVTMLHREDIGVGREMAKMAFSRGIWSYVTKMEQNLRKYILVHTSDNRRQPASPDAVSLCSKMNIELGSFCSPPAVQSDESNASPQASKGAQSRDRNASTGENSRRVGLITQSMFLLGWAVFLGHGSTSLGAKIAAAVFMNNAVRRRKKTQPLPRDPSRYVSKSFSIHR